MPDKLNCMRYGDENDLSSIQQSNAHFFYNLVAGNDTSKSIDICCWSRFSERTRSAPAIAQSSSLLWH